MGGVHGWGWVPFGRLCPLGRDPTGDTVAAGSHLPCSVHPDQDQKHPGTASGLCLHSTGTTPEARLALYRNSTGTISDVPGQYLNHL